MVKQTFFLFPPERGIVGEEIFNGLFDCRRGGGERAGLKAVEQLDIPFFLPRDDVVDEHGALRGDGFVNGGTAGFADDEVM